MEFLVLGPLEARAGGQPLALSGPKQRALLAILLIHANEVVSTDRLIDELWANDPPGTGAAALQMRVSALRKTLHGTGQRQSASDRLITRAPGYLLRVDPDELDSLRFERLLTEGRRAMREGRPDAAAVALREGLSLWRGAPFADFADASFAQTEIARLDELRAAALEERIQADLELGRHVDVIGELEAHVAAYPLRERPSGQLILALYRAGRQADALAVYHATRRVLVEDLGLEPGAALQLLERQILLQDPALDARVAAVPARVQEVKRPPPERRRTVTIAASAFLEPAGPQMDPEPLRQISERCATTAATVYERHGGVVEPMLGPGLLAVFGSPVLHEDDALRALRAAWSLDGALSSLSDELQRDYGVRLSIRTGVATGEVVTGSSAPGHPSIVGEPIALASELLQHAGPGQILLADSTRLLVRGVVHVKPIKLTGAAPAWRLVELAPSAHARSSAPEATFVGRMNELAQLRAAYERARRDRTLQLCLVLGSAGIGKSRLVQEFLSEVRHTATIAVGRCLAYGEGITFWPLREIVWELAPGGDIASLLHDDADADAAVVAEHVAGAVGLAETVASVEETFWAVRRLFETVARDRPLVVVIEDIHWAEPTLLNMLEYVAARIREAPIILVCLARPELLAGRPGFGASSVNTISLFLEPLAEDESNALLHDRLRATRVDAATRARISGTAEGNPLFLEQMVAMVVQGVPRGELPVPATIQALLAARLDQLDAGEREILDRAAVIGKEFSPAAVAGLLTEEAPSSTRRHLDELVAKDLLRSVPAGRTGDEVFRFRHVLIQQSAYQSIPKRLRAEVHLAFANWLESKRGSPLTEVEEPVGYHLEQAVRYRSEIAPISDEDRRLASRAADRLASAGLRAFKAGDMPASGNLLGRATALLPPDDAVRLGLLTDLGFALFEVGDLERSSAVLAEVTERAVAMSDRQMVARATVQRDHVEMYRHPEQVDQTRLLRRAAAATRVLRAAHDDAGLARTALLVSEVEWTLGSGARATRAAERAARFSRRAQSRREEAWSHGDYGYYAVFGPTTVADGTRRLERWLAQAGGNAVVEANLVGFLAPLAAMEGRIAEAREQLAHSREATEALGLRWQTGTHDLLGSVIEMLAGDPVAAEVHLRRSIEMFTEMGDIWFLSILSIEQARALYEQRRDQDALALIDGLDAMPTDPSFSYRIRRAEILGRLLARAGKLDAALALARDAVELAGRTDFLGFHGDALTGLAEVHRLGARPEAATEALTLAITLYERKGNLVAAQKARSEQARR